MEALPLNAGWLQVREVSYMFKTFHPENKDWTWKYNVKGTHGSRSGNWEKHSRLARKLTFPLTSPSPTLNFRSCQRLVCVATS